MRTHGLTKRLAFPGKLRLAFSKSPPMNRLAFLRLPILRQLAAGGALSFCTAVAAFGEAVEVVNAGFEEMSANTFGEFSFGPLPGWQLYDPGLITGGGASGPYFIGTMTPFMGPHTPPGEYSYFPDGAAEGSRVGIAFNYAHTGGGGEYGFRQVLSTTLEEGMTYTLQVEIGNIGSGYSQSEDYFELSGFPGYQVELWAGDVLLASDNNSLAGLIPDGQFGTSTVTFTPTAGQEGLGDSLEIRLINLNVVDPAHASSDLEVDFDNVRLDASAVPEPGVAGLLLLGAGAALLRRRRG